MPTSRSSRPRRASRSSSRRPSRSGPRSRSATIATSTSDRRSSRPTTPASTRSSRSCATRTRRWPPSRIVRPRTATTRSSASSARVTASRSRAARTDRMPLILGQERLIPGFEANLIGLERRRLDRIRRDVPRGLRRDRRLAGQTAHFAVGPQGASREDPAGARRRLRPADGRLRRRGRPAHRHPRPARAPTRSTRPATRSRIGSSSTPWPTRRSSCPRSWWTRRSR